MRLLLAIFLASYLSALFAVEVPIDDFSLQSYSQNVDDFLSPKDKDYTDPILEKNYQNKQLDKFYNHYYSTKTKALSPWSEAMIQKIAPIVKNIELEILQSFDNANKMENQLHYQENFKLQSSTWLKNILNNMQINKLDNLDFNQNQRAIAVNNTFARALPELAPDFYHFTQPGQGFPFDNLQESAIWIGTPLYVFIRSHDKAWSLALTPEGYFAWVKSNDITYVSPAFIHQWQVAAQKGLMAVTKTGISLISKDHQFISTAYIGSIFPKGEAIDSILVPVKNAFNKARIETAYVRNGGLDLMPLKASKKNFANLLKQLQGRPYGWGGAFFYNDCSQELKSLFTPFGIWLPRNSLQQSKLESQVDLSQSSMEERLAYLKEHGQPLMTIIYVGGHVMLFIGNHKNNALTYQNLWGLAPKSRDKRYIVGASVFLPLLSKFTESPDINSQADKPIFKLAYLDRLVEKNIEPQEFIKSLYFNENFNEKTSLIAKK